MFNRKASAIGCGNVCGNVCGADQLSKLTLQKAKLRVIHFILHKYLFIHTFERNLNFTNDFNLSIMKNRLLHYGFAFLITMLLTNCASQQMTTIVSHNYNETKDVTEYSVFPLGQVSIPGKWTKGRYNSIARQQFFSNNDSITISIAFAPCNKFEFNFDGKLKGLDFVKAYYQWEANYYKANGHKAQIIETNNELGYMIFRIYDNDANTFFLSVVKNGILNNFSILITDKWSETEKIEFLKKLYK